MSFELWGAQILSPIIRPQESTGKSSKKEKEKEKKKSILTFMVNKRIA